jgi:hypothetical protein
MASATSKAAGKARASKASAGAGSALASACSPSSEASAVCQRPCIIGGDRDEGERPVGDPPSRRGDDQSHRQPPDREQPLGQQVERARAEQQGGGGGGEEERSVRRLLLAGLGALQPGEEQGRRAQGEKQSAPERPRGELRPRSPHQKDRSRQRAAGDDGSQHPVPAGRQGDEDRAEQQGRRRRRPGHVGVVLRRLGGDAQQHEAERGGRREAVLAPQQRQDDGGHSQHPEHRPGGKA